MFSRYQRGSRSLAANLSLSQSSAGAAAVTAEVQAEEQEEYDIPEEVETVIGELPPFTDINLSRSVHSVPQPQYLSVAF